jgi:hypothetical protein
VRLIEAKEKVEKVRKWGKGALVTGGIAKLLVCITFTNMRCRSDGKISLKLMNGD